MSKYEGYNESRKKAIMKYRKDNIERFTLDLPKGKKDEYKAQAAAKGKSLTAYIVELIERDREQ